MQKYGIVSLALGKLHLNAIKEQAFCFWPKLLIW